MEALQFFKCLGDATRLKIILLLTDNEELCVCEFTEALDESQPKISRHLAQLRQCELIQDRRQGQWIFYSLNKALPNWAHETLKTTLLENRHLIDQPALSLSKMHPRPVRCCD